MDWVQVGSLALIIIGCAAWIHSDFRTVEARLDTHIVAINERVDAANARTDQLISVMIDLLKDQKGRQ